ncbi:hypothetical protein BU23DRAFT_457291 [Bimuria novae-zelandiae CBS 107.79]|uniref:Tcp11-domain-containing protein n=1 Tax=Bimuria novae-zelandiae CBS 107.79 TaxID=1447943 RepID=A0A6A5VFS7_9PLEO|nr:hypothetical protein BU23DRAFT_457291 [Bimuria novae-zelandiae CBS 107.79]
MNAQTPASTRAADAFLPLPTSGVDGTQACKAANGSTWDGAIVSAEGVTRDGSRRVACHHQYTRPRSLSLIERDISEELVDVLMDYLQEDSEFKDKARREELADAFRHAAEFPPITKQSLSELDIQNIISNIKLRHDVNFDRDLSFRPNTEGPKGQQKNLQSQSYWLALQAELHLYTRLFRGTPTLRHVEPSVYFQHAQKRVPKLFATIHEVLKSLVPDRDHDRVDEHLDVRMLMQEIERGVCDMVALVEWTAHLLKEHCAPMRDGFVDGMVSRMRKGAANQDMATIVDSLRSLLGMLETMKLDVANHQIRNLKTLLIEDTVNYESHYHLDRIVNQRAKVNVDAAQKWWAGVVRDLQLHHTSATRDIARAKLESFSHAVTSSLSSRNSQQELPDTFYLDSDRLRALRLEIEDLTHFEICFTMFNQLRKDLGHYGTVLNDSKSRLRSSLAAILGENVGHGSQTWMNNSESLSLEIYRQAHAIAGRPPTFNHCVLHNTNECLRTLFYSTFSSHAVTLEAVLLPQVLTCVSKHYNGSPTELYNSLVATPLPNSTPSFIPLPPTVDTFSFCNNTPQERLTDLSKRISHIVLLHWRIWANIAYVQNDAAPTNAQLSTPPPPQSSTRPHPVATSSGHTAPLTPTAPICPSVSEHEVQAVDMMKTVDPPDPGSGYESGVSEETRLP